MRRLLYGFPYKFSFGLSSFLAALRVHKLLTVSVSVCVCEAALWPDELQRLPALRNPRNIVLHYAQLQLNSWRCQIRKSLNMFQINECVHWD